MGENMKKSLKGLLLALLLILTVTSFSFAGPSCTYKDHDYVFSKAYARFKFPGCDIAGHGDCHDVVTYYEFECDCGATTRFVKRRKTLHD